MHVLVRLGLLEYFDPLRISIADGKFEKFGPKGEFAKYFLYEKDERFLIVYMRLNKGEKVILKGEDRPHRIKYNAVVVLVSETRDTTDQITQNLIPEQLKFGRRAPGFLEKTLESNFSPAFDSFKKDETEIAISSLVTHMRFAGFA